MNSGTEAQGSSLFEQRFSLGLATENTAIWIIG
jgi:hypothetical protein